MSAAASCATGGVCAVGPRVTDVIRGMREKDGRCVGCGRKVDAVSVVTREVGEARDLALTTHDPADVALRATSTEGLVDTVIRLTHQIAGLIASSKPDADERARELRLQRSFVKLEIVRRAS